MASTHLQLQKELFTPNDEQLLSLAHCFRVSSEAAKKSKRKDVYLCIVNETNQPQFNISVCEVKPPERRQDVPKKKRSWSLRELRSVDGRCDPAAPSTDGKNDLIIKEDGGDIELGFGDKLFSWSVVNLEEKKRFLSALVSLSSRQQSHSQVRKVVLKNLPAGVMAEDEVVAAVMHESTAADKWGSYQAISDKEASDLLSVMKNCEHAITNADLFVEDLNRQLNILDGDNIYSIMASEESIDNLMKLLDVAIKHAEHLESRLNQYDELMEPIRESMGKMEGKTGNFETVNCNNKKLLALLQSIVKQLDLPYHHQHALLEPDFSQPQKIKECSRAAEALEHALSCHLDQGVVKLAAVQDQRKRCEKLRDKFSKSVYRHLSNIFVHLGNDADNLESTGTELKLTRRRSIHRELLVFCDLMHWMKKMDPKSFAQLQSLYRTSMCKLYDKELKRFFETAKLAISGASKLSTASVTGSSQDLLAGKKAAASRLGARGVSGGAGTGLLGSDNDSLVSDTSLSEHERFDDIMETILLDLESLCMDEQTFSIKFFKMEESAAQRTSSKVDKAKNMEEARGMMAEIFPSLEQELLQFISTYEKLDSFFTMHALVRLSKHVLSSQDTGSFLAISLGTVLVQVKRHFDKFMQLQLKSIEESKVPRRAASGSILPFVNNFDKFAQTTENIFRNSERRSDLEKWYSMLVSEMLNSIQRLAKDYNKTPPEVVKLENYHHLHRTLSSIKIASLDTLKKEAKLRYNEALQCYVVQYFGRPLEKLTLFFDGIQQLLSAGVKESEISYQLAYSKQELRKVIANYPSREVKKGLDNLYKKVERHLTEQEGLIQVVWRAMQEEFIVQYKAIEDLIQRCYPGSQISLDFSIQDVLQFFTDIARSH